jgi:CubicO group peptidase (beta-lactamase class C family)
MLTFLISFALHVPAVATDAVVTDAVEAWAVPGAAVAVVRGGDTLLLKGYGVRRVGGRQPVTPDTVFPLASCSKAFTTTLLAMLVDDGTLGWDDKVRGLLPEFRLSDPHADALLTVRDLLCHRTGLGGHDLLWYRAPWSLDETLARARFLPLDYPFRGGFRYSSIPYLAAGRVAEKRAGKKWDALVRARVCEPLGMTGVAFTTTGVPGDAATGHRAGPDGKAAVTPGYVMAEPNPSGSVHASARDLAAWLKFHLADGVGPDGRRLVSVKNLNETKAPHNPIRLEGAARALNPDTVQLCYALGWLVYDHRGKKVVSHGGLIDGFRVQVTMLPDENLGFAVLTNLHDTRMNAALTNTLIDLHCGLPPRDWNAHFRKVAGDEEAERRAAAARNAARKAEAGPALPAAGYAGEYAHPAYGPATVTAAGGQLVLKFSTFTCPLDHLDGDTFRVTSGFFADRPVSFEVTGKVATGLTFIEQRFERK